MLESLLVLSAAVNRATEVVKNMLDRRGVTGQARTIVIVVASILFGIGVVIFGDSNVSLFEGTTLEAWNPWAARLITGIAVGLGADFLHLLVDLIQSIKNMPALRSTPAMNG